MQVHVRTSMQIMVEPNKQAITVHYLKDTNVKGNFIEDEYYQMAKASHQCYVRMTCNTLTPSHPSTVGIARNTSCTLGDFHF